MELVRGHKSGLCKVSIKLSQKTHKYNNTYPYGMENISFLCRYKNLYISCKHSCHIYLLHLLVLIEIFLFTFSRVHTCNNRPTNSSWKSLTNCEWKKLFKHFAEQQGTMNILLQHSGDPYFLTVVVALCSVCGAIQAQRHCAM